MKQDRSHVIDTLDPGSLDGFITALVEAGFEPSPGEGARWRGPIHPAFKKLTQATEMEILIQDGWPARHPRVHVQGLQIEHVNQEGEVCLWRDDDPTMEWATLPGLLKRIEEWCDRARSGFRSEDRGLDAHLYLQRVSSGLAIINLDEFRSGGALNDGAFEAIYGTLENGALRLTTRQIAGDVLKGRWYYRSKDVGHPRDLQSFRSALTSAQQRHFYNGIPLFTERKRGAADLLVLIWETGYGTNVLVVMPKGRPGGGIELLSIEAARSDLETLHSRSGLDAELLSKKGAVLFGAGAIGSHVALCLAGAGLGKLTLVDGDRLRPGNVVRHALGRRFVGENKARAMKEELTSRSPWTRVQAEDSHVWSPRQIAGLCDSMDVVIDASGNAAFSILISQTAERQKWPLVSVALYRGGTVARVRRQWRSVPAIYRRASLDSYPLIPPGDGEESFLETGCSAPVNLAAPQAVMSAAALASQVSIDALCERAELSDEIVDVYRSLPQVGFERFTRRLVA